MKRRPPQPNLDYDMWLGPAPYKPYHTDRVHYKNRFYWDYEGGDLTNFGAHSMDPLQWTYAKDDTGPVRIEPYAPWPQHPDATPATDNGKEFARFGSLEAKLGLDVYFARPYHAWERATNENTNGLLRQFFPKGLDLRRVTHAHVRRVEYLLNTRPRKCPGYRTPHEVLRE